MKSSLPPVRLPRQAGASHRHNPKWKQGYKGPVGVLRDGNPASKQPKKNRRRKRAGYERTHSNSMRHTDCKRPDDGRRFIAYRDDASRCITGFGVSDEATEHAVRVLYGAMAIYGKPASILTDHGSQFYASVAECKGMVKSEFEKDLAGLEIKYIPARAGYLQTDGKPAWFHQIGVYHCHHVLYPSADRRQAGMVPRGTAAPLAIIRGGIFRKNHQGDGPSFICGRSVSHRRKAGRCCATCHVVQRAYPHTF